MDKIQQQIYDNTTGIEADDMYRMSRGFISDVAASNISTNSLRVLHALAHATCRRLSGWSEDHRQPEEGYLVASRVLKERLGLVRANCNRDLLAGAEESDLTTVLDWLEFRHGTEWLSWRFNDRALAYMLENSTYGLLDASGLPTLKRPIDFHLFGLMSLHRRMRTAKFEITVPEMWPWIKADRADWSYLRRPFIAALQKSCSIYNLNTVVLLSCHGNLRGIDTIQIRLRSAGSLWSVERLGKTDPMVRKCVIVGPQATHECLPQRLPDTLTALRAFRWDVGKV